MERPNDFNKIEIEEESDIGKFNQMENLQIHPDLSIVSNEEIKKITIDT